MARARIRRSRGPERKLQDPDGSSGDGARPSMLLGGMACELPPPGGEGSGMTDPGATGPELLNCAVYGDARAVEHLVDG